MKTIQYIIIAAGFTIFFGKTFAQNIQSIHAEESLKYSEYNLKSEKQWDSLNNFTRQNKNTKQVETKDLNKIVFGWNPYWMGTAYYDYDYSLLSEVSYFSCEVNPNTGYPDDVHYWLTTELVDIAHSNNTNVSLTVTLFSGHQTFFENSQSIQNLIDTLVGLVKYRNADGVNIDFEAVPSSQSENLTSFMINLSEQFHAEIPGSTVSIALPSVNWSSTFDTGAMNPYVDIFLIMGYGYYWSGSSQAGPVSPKNSGDIWWDYDATQSVNYYLAEGISPEKLCLAIPYYGRDWITADNGIPSATLATGGSRTYKRVRDEYSQYTQGWNLDASTPYYIYNSSGDWHQCWFDNETSLGKKYDMVKMKNLKGVGIWALGYDGNYQELKNMIAEKFTDAGGNICEDVFTDMGGPKGNYYNNEDYIFTISPQNAEQIKIFFDEFDVEANYDTLFVFDGADTNADLIGAYTGALNFEDTIKTTGGAVTFRFKSDNATTREGWSARWTCGEFSDIDEPKADNIKFSVSPVPFSDILFLNLSGIDSENINIKII